MIPYGHLSVQSQGQDIRFATKLLEYNKDNHWTYEKIISLLLHVAIPIFKEAFPGCQAIFLFDNVTSLAAFADDALLVSPMNLNPGSIQPLMRNGMFYCHSKPISQSMSENDIPKGMRKALEECSLWRQGLKADCRPKCVKTMTASDCCARKILGNGRDFREQRRRLQELIETHGHRVLFYPKL